MAGLLNKALVSTAAVKVATVPSTIPYGSINIVVSNHQPIDVTLELWIAIGENASQQDNIEPGVVIPGKGRYECSCRIVSPNESVFAKASAEVAVRVELVEAGG